MALALVSYFDRYYKSQDDPYLETREREERFVNQIVTAVEAVMEKTLLVFLAGCIAGMTAAPSATVSTTAPPSTQETAAADVDWDFLGE